MRNVTNVLLICRIIINWNVGEGDMELNKAVFLEAVYELLEEEGLKKSDMFKATTISKTTWGRMEKDPSSSSMPDINQLLKLCDFLNTTLYYLLFRIGPKQATPALIGRMNDVMEAFSDRDFPDKRILISRVTALDKHDALLALRKVSDSLIESFAISAKHRDEDPSGYLRALERHS